MKDFINNNNGYFVLLCFMAPYIALLIAGLIDLLFKAPEVIYTIGKHHGKDEVEEELKKFIEDQNPKKHYERSTEEAF